MTYLIAPVTLSFVPVLLSEDSRLKKSSMKKSPAKQENNRGKIGF